MSYSSLFLNKTTSPKEIPGDVALVHRRRLCQMCQAPPSDAEISQETSWEDPDVFFRVFIQRMDSNYGGFRWFNYQQLIRIM